eukprot:m.98686 g.98686  ORF g.98686 m.98686 type:complete len:488 (+) comp15291_c0_seq1:67-1530(+)
MLVKADVQGVVAALADPGTPVTGLALSSRYLNGQRFRDELAPLIASASALESVDFSGQQLGPAGAEALAQCIRANPRLHSFNLTHNDIGTAGVTALAASIAASHADKDVVLDLSFNTLGTEGFQGLTIALPFCVELYLGSTDMRAADVAQLSFSRCEALTVLDLNSNNFGAAGAVVLQRELTSLGRIRKLNLGHCDFPGGVMAGLVAALNAQEQPPLDALTLDWNDIGDEGAQALGVLFETHPPTRVSLKGCGITDVGVVAMISKLQMGAVEGLAQLNLEDNVLSDVGLTVLTETIAASPSLDMVSVSDTEAISDAALDRLEAALALSARDRRAVACALLAHVRGACPRNMTEILADALQPSHDSVHDASDSPSEDGDRASFVDRVLETFGPATLDAVLTCGGDTCCSRQQLALAAVRGSAVARDLLSPPTLKAMARASFRRRIGPRTLILEPRLTEMDALPESGCLHDFVLYGLHFARDASQPAEV